MASSQLLAKQDHELLTTLELDDLQAHVKKQMEEGFCDSRINRAIIRLYSLHPDELDEDVVVNILALSLIALPEPDFFTHLCMIPQALQDSERVKGLMEVETLLQAGKFGQFWERTREADVAETLAAVTGFGDGVRKFMVSALLITYSSIKTTALERSLGIEDAAAFAAAKGWKVEGTGEEALVHFPANSENQPKPTEIKQAATFTDISHLMQVLGK